MSRQNLTLIDEATLRRYTISGEDVSLVNQWSMLRQAYPDNEMYQPFHQYVQYLHGGTDMTISEPFDFSSDRLGVLTRVRIDPIYENSISNINQYMLQSSNPHRTIDNTERPLPIAVRYINEQGDYYIEHYPIQVPVTFSDSGRKPYISESQQIKIWIPWTLMRINLRRNVYQFLYAAGHSLMSEDDYYFVGPFPNSYAEGNICWANSLANYDGMMYDNTLQCFPTDHRTFYSIAFNEYFSGGWNTDLGSSLTSMLYHNYHLYYKHLDQLPMINRFLNPDREYVQTHLRHISAPRRGMIANGLLSLMQSRLKSTAYALYMMSTFTLEETLQFWNEINSFPTLLPNYQSLYVKKFSDIVKPLPNSSVHSSPHSDWMDLSDMVAQHDDLLLNRLQNHGANRNMYIYTYNLDNISPNTKIHVFNLREIGTNFAYNQIYHHHQLIHDLYRDFINTGLNDVTNRHVYLIDYAHKTWTKMLVPESERLDGDGFDYVPALDRQDLIVSHHALTTHRQLVAEVV